MHTGSPTMRTASRTIPATATRMGRPTIPGSAQWESTADGAAAVTTMEAMGTGTAMAVAMADGMAADMAGMAAARGAAGAMAAAATGIDATAANARLPAR